MVLVCVILDLIYATFGEVWIACIIVIDIDTQ